MDFFDVVNTRASCRDFVPTDITDADLNTILDSARRAPTAFTIQPWHFIVTRDAGKVERLREVQDVGQAGAVIAAVGDPAASDFWKEDLAAAIENMHMACTALGYASLWVAVLPEKESLVREAFAIPAGLQPLALLPIGAAREPVTQAARKAMGEIAHDETFGTSWDR